jgi:hypothetical protein
MLLQLKDKLPARVVTQRELHELGIYKLPQTVYQVLYDIGLHYGEDGKSRVLKVLLEYIHEKYPGQTLGDFIDLSSKEAYELHHIVKDLDFGLYFTLQDKLLLT